MAPRSNITLTCKTPRRKEKYNVPVPMTGLGHYDIQRDMATD